MRWLPWPHLDVPAYLGACIRTDFPPPRPPCTSARGRATPPTTALGRSWLVGGGVVVVVVLVVLFVGDLRVLMYLLVGTDPFNNHDCYICPKKGKADRITYPLPDPTDAIRPSRTRAPSRDCPDGAWGWRGPHTVGMTSCQALFGRRGAYNPPLYSFVFLCSAVSTPPGGDEPNQVQSQPSIHRLIDCNAER